MAELRAGARMKLGRLPSDVRKLLASHVAVSAESKMQKLSKSCRRDISGKNKTAIIEFSRGADASLPLPLDPPFGYRFALSRLNPDILKKASILYINVSPEESRRRNAERAVLPPGCTDTTLFHGVPTEVMLRDYGRDDFMAMCDLVPGKLGSTVQLQAHGRLNSIPAGIFNNDDDLTSFIRKNSDSNEWPQKDCDNL
ncbi:MAG: hypothetical protein COT13_06335, partial [Chloroflexi bacterium CG08_land_8_20_14_0_20_45_12]